MGDNNVLVERLLAQDLETSGQPPSNKRGVKSIVHIGDNPEAESDWEIVGATKKKNVHHVSPEDDLLSQLNETHLEKAGGVAPETAAAGDVAPKEVISPLDGNAPTRRHIQEKGVIDTTTAVDHEELPGESSHTVQDDDKPKKYRRRGKKGGKQVNKKPKHPDEDETPNTTEAGNPDAMESETTHFALDFSSSSWLADASGHDDSSTNASKIEEPSPLIAPAKVQDIVDDGYEWDIEINKGNEPTHILNEHSTIALAPDDTSSQDRADDMSHATTLVSEDESEDLTADTTAVATKKSRKRGIKGGKKVQKKRTAQQDRDAKWSYWHAVVVVFVVAVFGHGWGRLMMSRAA